MCRIQSTCLLVLGRETAAVAAGIRFCSALLLRFLISVNVAGAWSGSEERRNDNLEKFVTTVWFKNLYAHCEVPIGLEPNAFKV